MKISLILTLVMLVLLCGCSDYTSIQNISLATKEVCKSHGRDTSTRPKMNTGGNYEYKCHNIIYEFEETSRVLTIDE